MDIPGSIALIIYGLLTAISALTTYVYYVSNKFKPNFMIKATTKVFFALTLSSISIFLMRIATPLGLHFVHTFKNPILIIPRIILMLSLLNFLRESTRFDIKEKKNKK